MMPKPNAIKRMECILRETGQDLRLASMFTSCLRPMLCTDL